MSARDELDLVSAAGPVLSLSDAVSKCNGQDISRKGGKAKSLMIVLPTDMSFLKNTDGDFAYLENLNSTQPELVVEVTGGELRFLGKFVETCSAYMSIDIQPTKKQSVCNDPTTRILVFDPPTFKSTANSDSSKGYDVSTDSAPPATPGKKDDVANWLQHFGCSALSQPRLVKYSSSQRSRLSTTSSISQRSTVVKKTNKSLTSVEANEEEIESIGNDPDSEEGGDENGGTVKSSRKRVVAPRSKNRKEDYVPTTRKGTRKRTRVSYADSDESEEVEESENGSEESSWDE
jgi:hypothetical protein